MERHYQLSMCLINMRLVKIRPFRYGKTETTKGIYKDVSVKIRPFRYGKTETTKGIYKDVSVKIRPFRYGNLFTFAVSYPATPPLKSDRFGMEIFLHLQFHTQPLLR